MKKRTLCTLFYKTWGMNMENMKKLKRFFAYYRPHKRLFIIDLICSFTISMANMFYPMIAREMMKSVESKNLQLLITLGIVLGLIYIDRKSVV